MRYLTCSSYGGAETQDLLLLKCSTLYHDQDQILGIRQCELLQDGQEFFKLLLSHLEAKLSKSPDGVRSPAYAVQHTNKWLFFYLWS